MIYIALCILLCAVGHMVRDGWPTLHSTHLARGLGAAWCYFGALSLFSPHDAAALAAAVWIGFYFDMKHGEGQGPWSGTLHNLPYLILSGVTSLVPLDVALSAITGHYLIPWCLAGLVKPAIWWTAWAIKPDRFWSFLQPTRVAAITFGAVVGALFLLA